MVKLFIKRNDYGKQSKTLLTPCNCALLLIDHQSQMLFVVQSHDRALIISGVIGFAKAAKVSIFCAMQKNNFAVKSLRTISESR